MADSSFPVVLYGRVSEIRDDRSTSVDDQLAGGRTWADREGWPVVAEFRDDNISASRFAEGKQRPDWDRAVDAITTGQARAILMWEYSRGTRDLEVSAQLAKVLRRHNAYLGYNGRLYDPGKAADAFAMGIDALSAQRHSDETSERVRRAAESRAARGLPHAQLPYGYIRVIDPHTGRVTGYGVHPEQGPIVQEIIRRLLASPREPANSIAADLNRRGIPTAATGRCTKDCGCRKRNGRPDPHWEGEHAAVSGRWIGRNVSKLAQHPAYAGLRVRDGRVLDGVTAAHPPLISLAEHHQVKAMYGSPDRDKWRQSTRVRHLGAGIFRCGRDGCGGRMRVGVYPSGSAYTCRKCFKVARRQVHVDEWVKWMMIERLLLPDVLALLAGVGDDQRQDAEAEVVRLRAEEAEAQQMLDRGEITLADLAVWRKGWKRRMTAAEAAAQPPESFAAVAMLAGPDAEAKWDAAPIGLLREAVDKMAVVTILPTGRRGGTPQPFNPELVRIEWRGTS